MTIKSKWLKSAFGFLIILYLAHMAFMTIKAIRQPGMVKRQNKTNIYFSVLPKKIQEVVLSDYVYISSDRNPIAIYKHQGGSYSLTVYRIGSIPAGITLTELIKMSNERIWYDPTIVYNAAPLGSHNLLLNNDHPSDFSKIFIRVDGYRLSNFKSDNVVSYRMDLNKLSLGLDDPDNYDIVLERSKTRYKVEPFELLFLKEENSIF